jgi:small conductance mechanosensitive channel
VDAGGNSSRRAGEITVTQRNRSSRAPRRQRRQRRRTPATGRQRAQRSRAGAQARLRRFRQGSLLAVGATALLLLLIGAPSPAETPLDAPLPTVPAQAAPDSPDPILDTVPRDPADAAREATGTLRDLALGFYAALPVIAIALGLLLVAAVLARLVGLGLRAALASWERAQAFAALVSIFIWLMAIGAALSVLAGDPRVLVGSVGLFGLALSWALQAPIESFTGWLLNSFRSYYRIGDRIAVGEVFGDVVRIDFLTTTVFEAGGPDKPVQAAQSTGALVTFPNLEVLRSNIVNFTRDFPYVWDELTITVGNGSDLALAVQVLEEAAAGVMGETMDGAADEYAALLERARLAGDMATRPQVFASSRDLGVDLTIRYLVPAREMRRWASRLLLAVNRALAEPDVARHVFQAIPRVRMHDAPVRAWSEASGENPDPGAGS